jgi:hypothetical protein
MQIEYMLVVMNKIYKLTSKNMANIKKKNACEKCKRRKFTWQVVTGKTNEGKLLTTKLCQACFIELIK